MEVKVFPKEYIVGIYISVFWNWIIKIRIMIAFYNKTLIRKSILRSGELECMEDETIVG